MPDVKHLPRPEHVAFTPRESEVLVRVCEGDTNKDIAELFGISVETVKEHISNMLHKSKCRDRTQMVAWSFRGGIVKLNIKQMDADLKALKQKARMLASA